MHAGPAGSVWVFQMHTGPAGSDWAFQMHAGPAGFVWAFQMVFGPADSTWASEMDAGRARHESVVLVNEGVEAGNRKSAPGILMGQQAHSPFDSRFLGKPR